MDELKQKEYVLFKAAQGKNLTVMKSKNGYMIVDYFTDRILAGHGYALSFEDAERFVKGYCA